MLAPAAAAAAGIVVGVGGAAGSHVSRGHEPGRAGGGAGNAFALGVVDLLEVRAVGLDADKAMRVHC